MFLSSSVRSLSGGVITFLGVLTLLATQQPLSASQVDDSRLGASFVSYLIDIDNFVQSGGEALKNGTFGAFSDKANCSALVAKSGGCNNSTYNQPLDESKCKPLYEQFECEREAACRLCGNFVAALFMQNREPKKVAEYATCSQLGFKYTPECPSPMMTIILMVVGVLAVLGIGGGAAFMMLRGGRKSGSGTGGTTNKNQSSTGGGGGTSKSATKSAKAGSSTGGTSGPTPSGPARV